MTYATLIPHRSQAWVAVVDDQGFTLGLATYGEAGYAPFIAAQRRGFEPHREAWDEANAINERIFNLTPEDSLAILVDSMRR